MTEASLLSERRASVRPETRREGPSSEAAEVAHLLACAGVDHASTLWFQLLELATQQASDWVERAAASGAPMSPRAAAILGLRAVASEILLALPGDADGAGGAAEACLGVCVEDQAQASRLPARRRRWVKAPNRPPRRGRAPCNGASAAAEILDGICEGPDAARRQAPSPRRRGGGGELVREASDEAPRLAETVGVSAKPWEQGVERLRRPQWSSLAA